MRKRRAVVQRLVLYYKSSQHNTQKNDPCGKHKIKSVLLVDNS